MSFDEIPPVDEATRARLHARLVTAAQRDGVLDLAYSTMDTPVGELMLVATEQGLLRVVSPRILRAPQRLDEATRQLAEYFEGSRTRFDLPLDFRLSKGFRRSVLDHLPEIGYGQTWSYAEVAQAAGSPRAVRAVGTACATNPLPVVVPCHRVVRSDGSYGQYLGGVEAKRKLLTLEAA
jgi:methylated-DNA-[protein]-cysteine S-methyltransferase